MTPDSLYQLLPAVYRIRDIERGLPLKALMQLMSEQATFLHADVEHLYDNWFIETCDDWVVPYLGELVGFRRSHPVGEPGDVATSASIELIRRLYPRREVSRLIDTRRRKGTLPVLENLALFVAGWRGRAVENSKYLAISWMRELACCKARLTADVRNAVSGWITPSGQPARSVDVRQTGQFSPLPRPRIQSLSLLVWRRSARSVSMVTPKTLPTSGGWTIATFSPFGLRTALVVLGDEDKELTEGKQLHCEMKTGQAEESNTECSTVSEKTQAEEDVDDELTYSIFLRRQLLRRDLERPKPRYYGSGKSLQIEGVESHQLKVVDLKNLDELNAIPIAERKEFYVDPELGRIAVPSGNKIPRVSYHYPASAKIGGGEYSRVIAQHNEYPVYRFAPQRSSAARGLSLGYFFAGQPQVQANGDELTVVESVGFELASSDVYPIDVATVRLRREETFELRAANKSRPVIELKDDELTVEMEPGSRLVLDGIALSAKQITIRSIPLEANGCAQGGGECVQDGGCAHDANGCAQSCECDSPSCDKLVSPPEVYVRHSTIAPWMAGESNDHPESECNPCSPWGATTICIPGGKLSIRHSIVGEMRIHDNCDSTGSCPANPLDLQISDSIVDQSENETSISDGSNEPAAAALTCARATLFGETNVHQIDAAEDVIFGKRVKVHRQQAGYIRFSYATPGGDLPRRFKCHPTSQPSSLEPKFVSKCFGHFGYGQLHIECPAEILNGAESESEMGAFHDLFEPQRKARLEAQLQDFTPADMHSFLVFVDEELP